MAKVIEPEKDTADTNQHSAEETANGSIWEVIDEIMRGVPAEVLGQLPADGAEQHDHYLYGSPRKVARES